VFVFRAHNTVNKRLDKPIPSSVAECLETLRQATSQTSFAQFRTAYISYLYQNWKRDLTGGNMIAVGAVRDMEKINNEYWSPRETSIPELNEDDVMIPIQKTNMRITISGTISSVNVGFAGGRLRLTKR
jgi:hypothetical protein